VNTVTILAFEKIVTLRLQHGILKINTIVISVYVEKISLIALWSIIILLMFMKELCAIMYKIVAMFKDVSIVWNVIFVLIVLVANFAMVVILSEIKNIIFSINL